MSRKKTKRPEAENTEDTSAANKKPCLSPNHDDTCLICLEADYSIPRGCACRGSGAKSHPECIFMWGVQRDDDHRAYSVCHICGYPYSGLLYQNVLELLFTRIQNIKMSLLKKARLLLLVLQNDVQHNNHNRDNRKRLPIVMKMLTLMMDKEKYPRSDSDNIVLSRIMFEAELMTASTIGSNSCFQTLEKLRNKYSTALDADSILMVKYNLKLLKTCRKNINIAKTVSNMKVRDSDDKIEYIFSDVKFEHIDCLIHLKFFPQAEVRLQLMKDYVTKTYGSEHYLSFRCKMFEAILLVNTGRVTHGIQKMKEIVDKAIVSVQLPSFCVCDLVDIMADYCKIYSRTSYTQYAFDCRRVFLTSSNWNVLAVVNYTEALSRCKQHEKSISSLNDLISKITPNCGIENLKESSINFFQKLHLCLVNSLIEACKFEEAAKILGCLDASLYQVKVFKTREENLGIQHQF